MPYQRKSQPQYARLDQSQGELSQRARLQKVAAQNEQ
jgi:hypothetical protein